MTAQEKQPSPNHEAIESFRKNLSGALLLPGEALYDQARTIWNSMIDRHPSFIVQCETTDDIVASIRFAKIYNLDLAVKGGGHNVGGKALCDGGLVVDLSRMKNITIDPATRVATVDPGVLLGELDEAAQQYALATPAGIMSETGISGLTLGGGLGWLSRKYGLTIDNLLSAEIITANGEKLTLSNDQHKDLFWAIRGGGGNFGIVTSFTFQLHQVGPEVFSGLIVYPLSEGRVVMQYHRDFVKQAPDELTAWQIIRKAPPLPFLPEAVHGQPVLITAFCYAGNPLEGERIMSGYAPSADALGQFKGNNLYSSWQKTIDQLQCDGKRNYWKSHNLTELSDDCIDTLLAFARDIPHPHTEIFIPHLEGAISRVHSDATAYGHRKTPFLLNIHGRWDKEENDTQIIRWVKELFDATKKFSDGSVYVNFLSEEGENRTRQAYTGKSWQRLAATKAEYDPHNFFRINQNVRPEESNASPLKAEATIQERKGKASVGSSLYQ